MKKILPVDLIIISRERCNLLLRCVFSIISNSRLPETLLILHALPPSLCTTKTEIQNLCKKHGIALKYLHIQDKGISFSRSKALELVKSEFFSFIDDDELVSRDWIKTGTEYLQQHQDVGAVSGIKYHNFPLNYWNKVWFELIKSGIDCENETDFVTSSNTFYRTQIFKNHQLKYDLTFSSSSEDRVMSFKLQQVGVKLIYTSQLFMSHDYRTTLKGFFKQWFDYGWTMAQFQKKYVYHHRNWIVQLASIASLTQGLRVPNSSILMIPGLFLTDVAFIFGYLSNFLKSTQ